jgi:histidine decarboxylase
MEKTRADLAMSLPVVVDGAVGPDSNYCMGYLNPGASGYGYISTLKLSTGIVSMAGLDPGTEGIVSYDRCEKNDAYIGQINMLTASSFCGVNGAVWGYHLATADAIKNGSLAPMFYQREAGVEIPVYPVSPLLDCATRLFGVAEQRRFPPMPGAHVVCANKNYTSDPSKGTGFVWAAIALAIADNRETESNLFIEDAGFAASTSPIRIEPLLRFLNGSLRAVTKSMVMCGVDQNVNYTKIFAGYVYQFVPKGYVGCSLTCAPYVLLAKKAIPPLGTPSDILKMTISQWEQSLGLPQLPRVVRAGESGDTIPQPAKQPTKHGKGKPAAKKKAPKKKASAPARRGAKGR